MTDENNEVNIPEPKRVSLILNGHNYDIQLVLSAEDFVELRTVDLSNPEMCLLFVGKLICRHVVNAEEDLLPESVNCKAINLYVDTFLLTDKQLEEIYHQNEADIPNYVKFLISLKKRYETKFVQPTNALLPAISNITQALLRFSEYIEPLIETVHSAIENITRVLPSIQEFFDNISNLVKSFSIPSITEEERQKMLEKCIWWGQIGWSNTEFLPQELIDFEPQDIDEANRIANSLLDKGSVELLFQQIASISGVKQSDLLELTQCFYNRRYKSCVLIAFSMIDSKIIRFQGRNSVNRKHGNEGIKKLEKRLKENHSSSFRFVLNQTNLLTCLHKMYEPSPNFSVQPKIVNRDFISHGMFHRKVTRRDAIQVILAMYNLYYLTDLYKMS